jgi:DNA-binding NarL/FixJ family response regulator
MLKVFIVDDHDTCRLALKLTVLLVKKYEIVGEAWSGKDLVEQILEKAPDVAIIDLSLPGKNGFEVFQELRRRGCRAKVVIWTAHMDAKTVDEAVRLEVDGYLCKGARPALMEEALAAVLDGKKWIDPSVRSDCQPLKSFEERHRAVTA